MEEGRAKKGMSPLGQSFFTVNKLVPSVAKPTFLICDLACAQWKVKAELLKKEMISKSYRLVVNPKRADIIFVVTCAYLKSPEELAIKAIKWFEANKRPGAEVIVMGCLPIINPEELRKVFKGRVININSREWLFHAPNITTAIPLHRKLLYIYRFEGVKGLAKRVGPFLLQTPFLNKDYFRGRTFSITISEGCAGACSFCSLKRVHGDMLSKPISSIALEIQEGLRKGYKTFVLLSKDSGGYGTDIGTNLVELLNTIFLLNRDFTVSIPSAINTSWFVKMTPDIIVLLKKFPGRIKGFGLSVQSGSDRILRAMNRGWTSTRMLKASLCRFKKALPDFPLAAQFIIGFPGETQADFSKSLELIESGYFSGIALFRYCERPFTASAKMANKVPASVINQRMRLAKQMMKHQGIGYHSYG